MFYITKQVYSTNELNLHNTILLDSKRSGECNVLIL